ncbi:MAG: DUF2905 domain-containing protein [Gammaproteobacteria bacterium]
MRRFLLVAGIACLALALIWPWLQRLGLGRLPGDIAIERDGLRLYFPITTCLLISAVLSALIWLLRR